jgi:hypothetical protein
MLRLAGLDIKQLSGPVSFRYLAPKREAFLENAEKGIFLPILILLGDFHKSEENRCEGYEEDGVYEIESDTFLDSLNELAKDIPIDYYLEVFEESSMDALVKDVGIINRVLDETILCFIPSLRKRACPYKNVKWHRSDPRQSLKTIESSSYGRHLYRTIFQPWELHETLSPMYVQDRVEGNVFMDFLTTIQGSIDDTIEVFNRKIAKAFADQVIGNKKSIVYKQIRKSKVEINLELYFYRYLTRAWAHRRMDDTNKTIREFILSQVRLDDMQLEEIFESFINIMTKGETVSERMKRNESQYADVVKTIIYIYQLIEPSYVDLYHTFRMIKTPKDSTNSYLSFGHFGEYHCRCIADLLTTELDYYEVVHSIVQPRMQELILDVQPDRCIRFDSFIDLDRTLQEYKELRAQYEH